MKELRVIACIASLMAGTYPSDMSAQVPLESLGNSIAWRVSPAVPTGTISGLVFSESGTPIEGASVFLAGAQHGVITESDGSFSLVHGVAGSYVLEIRHLGFRRLQEEFTIPVDHGIFVAAILQVQALHGLCSFVVCTRATQCGHLNVMVVDVTTALPPDAVVTIRLEHESGVLENSVKLTPLEPPHGHVGLGREIETEGRHAVEVSAPGYRTWRLEDVYLRFVPGCVPTLFNRDHRAELIPLDGA